MICNSFYPVHIGWFWKKEPSNGVLVPLSLLLEAKKLTMFWRQPSRQVLENSWRNDSYHKYSRLRILVSPCLCFIDFPIILYFCPNCNYGGTTLSLSVVLLFAAVQQLVYKHQDFAATPFIFCSLFFPVRLQAREAWMYVFHIASELRPWKEICISDQLKGKLCDIFLQLFPKLATLTIYCKLLKVTSAQVGGYSWRTLHYIAAWFPCICDGLTASVVVCLLSLA